MKGGAQFNQVQKDKILSDYKQVLTAFKTSFDALSVKSDFEEKKQMILLEIIDTMKALKKIEFPDTMTRKVVRKEIKQRFLDDENIYIRLKKLILLRERDRSTRENAIKVFKNIIKFTKKSCKIMLSIKLEIFISFILEREYKHAQVVKERLQCFKLIQTWLERDPKSFPFLFGQTIASIAKNPED